MQDAAFAVPAFASEVVGAGRAAARTAFAGKFEAEVNEFLDTRGGVADDLTDDAAVAQSVASGEGVGHVFVKIVGLRRDGRNAPLGVVGVGVGFVLFGQDGDGVPGAGALEREAKAGNAAADHQHIVIVLHEKKPEINHRGTEAQRANHGGVANETFLKDRARKHMIPLWGFLKRQPRIVANEHE